MQTLQQPDAGDPDRAATVLPCRPGLGMGRPPWLPFAFLARCLVLPLLHPPLRSRFCIVAAGARAELLGTRPRNACTHRGAEVQVPEASWMITLSDACGKLVPVGLRRQDSMDRRQPSRARLRVRGARSNESRVPSPTLPGPLGPLSGAAEIIARARRVGSRQPASSSAACGAKRS